jgi:hypothetical protein
VIDTVLEPRVAILEKAATGGYDMKIIILLLVMLSAEMHTKAQGVQASPSKPQAAANRQLTPECQRF